MSAGTELRLLKFGNRFTNGLAGPHNSQGLLRVLRLASSQESSRTWNFNIKAIAKDVLIRSAVWYTRANLNNNELYNATVAFVSASSEDVPCAIPYVRV